MYTEYIHRSNITDIKVDLQQFMNNIHTTHGKYRDYDDTHGSRSYNNFSTTSSLTSPPILTTRISTYCNYHKYEEYTLSILAMFDSIASLLSSTILLNIPRIQVLFVKLKKVNGLRLLLDFRSYWL